MGDQESARLYYQFWTSGSLLQIRECLVEHYHKTRQEPLIHGQVWIPAAAPSELWCGHGLSLWQGSCRGWWVHTGGRSTPC